jgi:hypothetical protein
MQVASGLFLESLLRLRLISWILEKGIRNIFFSSFILAIKFLRISAPSDREEFAIQPFSHENLHFPT